LFSVVMAAVAVTLAVVVLQARHRQQVAPPVDIGQQMG
jgi:hypothetical protein